MMFTCVFMVPGNGIGITTRRGELALWAEKIQNCGAARLWAYFNNDREGYAIRNARTLIRLLQSVSPGEEKSGIRFR